jgi:hypothetical protein
VTRIFRPEGTLPGAVHYIDCIAVEVGTIGYRIPNVDRDPKTDRPIRGLVGV